MKVSVISLKRTPERWNAFLQRNEKALSNCEIVSIDGIDGNEILNCRIKTRLINHTAHQEWSEGAIGAGPATSIAGGSALTASHHWW